MVFFPPMEKSLEWARQKGEWSRAGLKEKRRKLSLSFFTLLLLKLRSGICHVVADLVWGVWLRNLKNLASSHLCVCAVQLCCSGFKVLFVRPRDYTVYIECNVFMVRICNGCFNNYHGASRKVVFLPACMGFQLRKDVVEVIKVMSFDWTPTFVQFFLFSFFFFVLISCSIKLHQITCSFTENRYCCHFILPRS